MTMHLKSAMATGTLYINGLRKWFLFQLHDLIPIICVCSQVSGGGAMGGATGSYDDQR